MTKTIQTDVLIIGSGPAGYTAAIYAARANLKPHLVSGLEPGGQLTITTDVENYPGFGDVIQGPWLMEQMKEQAVKVGTEFHHDIVNSVKFDDKPFIGETDSGLIFNSKTRLEIFDLPTNPQGRNSLLKPLWEILFFPPLVFLAKKKLTANTPLERDKIKTLMKQEVF